MTDRPTRIKLISTLCRALEALLIDVLVKPERDTLKPDDSTPGPECVTQPLEDVAVVRKLLQSYQATRWCSDWTEDLVIRALGWRMVDDRARAMIALDALVGEGFIATEMQAGVCVYNFVRPDNSRGLRVGMTWQEVADNSWTKCESRSEDCFNIEQRCSACWFLDDALCKCGHSFRRHGADCKDCRHTTPDGCWSFSLASWPGMPPISKFSQQVADDVRAANPAADVVATHTGVSVTFPKREEQ